MAHQGQAVEEQRHPRVADEQDHPARFALHQPAQEDRADRAADVEEDLDEGGVGLGEPAVHQQLRQPVEQQIGDQGGAEEAEPEQDRGGSAAVAEQHLEGIEPPSRFGRRGLGVSVKLRFRQRQGHDGSEHERRDPADVEHRAPVAGLAALEGDEARQRAAGGHASRRDHHIQDAVLAAEGLGGQGDQVRQGAPESEAAGETDGHQRLVARRPDGRELEQAEDRHRDDERRLAPEGVGQPPADEGAEEQAERARHQHIAEVVRAEVELRAELGRGDAHRLQVDALDEGGAEAEDQGDQPGRRLDPAALDGRRTRHFPSPFRPLLWAPTMHSCSGLHSAHAAASP